MEGEITAVGLRLPCYFFPFSHCNEPCYPHLFMSVDGYEQNWLPLAWLTHLLVLFCMSGGHMRGKSGLKVNHIHCSHYSTNHKQK
jgi:hypothetical protein